MDTIYVTGHRNPDTDSIVAAIAYTALRNACGDREYEAACLGTPSDEPQSVLDKFGFQAPKRIYNVYNQIRDLDFVRPPVLSSAVTVGRAWDIMQENNYGTLPVANDDGTLYGVLSRDHVAGYHMSLITESYLQEVPLFNVLSVLEGTILNEAGETTDTISGNVVIALPQSQDTLLWQDPSSIVICGHQPYMIRRALEMNVNCLVLCETELTEELRNLPTKTCIITTPFDAYRASRLIFQSTPIGRICRTQDITTFHMDDRVEYAKEESLKHRESGYPILDENEQIVGMMNRYHLLRPRHKRVVLVDHNETSQSVPGLEEARIVHRNDSFENGCFVSLVVENRGVDRWSLSRKYRFVVRFRHQSRACIPVARRLFGRLRQRTDFWKGDWRRHFVQQKNLYDDFGFGGCKRR